MLSHLCLRLMDVTLTDDSGRFVWSLNQNGMFTVKSMYEDLMNGHTRFLHIFGNLKYRLKLKFSCGSWIEKSCLQKITLRRGTGMVIHIAPFVGIMNQLTTCLSLALLQN